MATVTLPSLHILLFYRKCSKRDHDAVKHRLHDGTTPPSSPFLGVVLKQIASENER